MAIKHYTKEYSQTDAFKVTQKKYLQSEKGKAKQKRYAQTEALLSEIPEASGRIQHVYLGMLNAAEWLRIIRVHSEHHLAIIHEIIGQEEAT